MSNRDIFTIDIAPENYEMLKRKMLNWLRSFSIFSYADNNGYLHAPNRYELLIAAGSIASGNHLPQQVEDWHFGHISYDFKNHIYTQLPHAKERTIPFEPITFFCPQIVAYIRHNTHTLVIESMEQSAEQVWKQIELETDRLPWQMTAPIAWRYNSNKDSYNSAIQALREHIAAGDCYEINFCREAVATDIDIDPIAAFYKLNQINPAPFAALYRQQNNWLLCSSPERYLYKEDSRLLSQPIKGTAKRNMDSNCDNKLKLELQQNLKERAENVMIVDLVRNDLALCAQVGTVQVDELFGVYTFPQVHQLISTVSAQLRPAITFDSIIQQTFPMGSMTGAPKYIVMQLINQYEQSARGLYSGSIGYINPEGNFDFNVVIRSLAYNQATAMLSYHTGGAITYDSDAEQEWQEVLLKAKALEQVFEFK